MSAPQYVPQAPAQVVRTYASPPRRPEPWIADRPGELSEVRQPQGVQLGYQGPDQGYVAKLARLFEGTLHLTDDEREEDAFAGCMLVALKRASLFGRAPVVHDLRLALTLFGFLGGAPDDLVSFRRPRFEQVANPHHYVEQRAIVDLVPEETLRLTPEQVAARLGEWRTLLVEVDEPPPPVLPEAPPVAATAAADESTLAVPEVEEPPPPAPEPEAAVEAAPDAAMPEVEPEPEPEAAVATERPAPEPPAEDATDPPVVDATTEPEDVPPAEAHVAPAEPPESDVSLADLVSEAKQAHTETAAPSRPASEPSSDPDVRARAIEAAARARRDRQGGTGPDTPSPGAGAEPAGGVGANVDPATRKKVIKRVKKIKKVVKKPGGASGQPGTGPQAKPGGKPGSLFGRPPES